MLWSVASQSLNLSKSSYLRGLRLHLIQPLIKVVKSNEKEAVWEKLRLKRFILRLPVLQLYNSQVKSNLFRLHVERKNFI